MATNNIKTPVMVLQELTVKRSLSPPEYTVIFERQGTHDNEFRYQVLAANVSAIGIGRSKQVAKHDAAQKALKELEAKGLYSPGETVVKAPRCETANASLQLVVNAIGNLNEVCVENKIPFPVFKEISDVGPPHCKEFTYQCQIASIVTMATSSTKKQAKQLAAKDMLGRIMDVLPELVAECNENFTARAITEKDTEAIEKFTELSKLNKPKPNFTLKIEDYDSHLRILMEEKEISFTSIEKYFDGEQNMECFKQLLDVFELDCAIEMLQDYPFIVALIVNTDVPCTTMGIGPTYESASQSAVAQAFEHFRLLCCGDPTIDPPNSYL